MTTATTTIAVNAHCMDLDPLGVTVTGPDAAGVWTITAPDSVSQVDLNAAVAAAAAEATTIANMSDLLAKAAAAQTNNATFLALASPTNAQTLAQVKALTRQCNALIKLQLGDLGTTSGT